MSQAETKTTEQFIADKNPQNEHETILIKTTAAFAIECQELANKYGCETGKVIGEILSIGYKSLKAISEGNIHVMTSLVDGKIHTEVYKNGFNEHVDP